MSRPGEVAHTGHAQVFPVFPPQLEAQAREALSVVLMQLDALDAAREEHLNAVRVAVNMMADAILEGPGTVFDPTEPVQIRDHHFGHPVRVAQLSMLLTHLAGGQRAHMRAAGMAAMLMNVGYVKMRQLDLESADPFGESQRAQLEAHSSLSAKLLAKSGLPAEVITAIAQHHERWNGSGYPDGLRKSAIGPIARVVGAADTYVGLCSQRFQRRPYTRQQVESYFRAMEGDLFDPRVVKALLVDLPGAVLFEHPAAA